MRNRKPVLRAFDLSAFRRIRLAESPAGQLPRRTFLIGATAAALAATPAAKAAKTIGGLGRLDIRRKTDGNGNLRRVTVRSGSSSWAVDLGRFDGSPTLSVEQSADGAVVAVRDAVLPGTRLRLSFAATIANGLTGRTIAFAFSDTGVEPGCFRTRPVGFEAWAQGEAQAVLEIAEPQTAALLGGAGLPFAASASLDPKTAAPISFTAACGFAAGAGVWEAFDGERRLPLSGFRLEPAASGAEGLVQGAGRHTRLEGARAGSWRGRFSVETAEGWRAEGPLAGFDALIAEIYPGDRAVWVLCGNGKRSVTARLLDQIELPLNHVCVGSYGGPEGRARAVSGSLARPVWAELPGVSVLLGALDDESSIVFASLETEEGSDSVSDVQVAAERYAFHVPDAVASAIPTRREALEIRAQPRPVVPPIQPRPIPTQPIPGPVVVQPGGPALEVQMSGIVGRLRLTPFLVDIVRREDQLHLRYEFVNMSLQTGADGPRVVRADSTKPAYVLVFFPPQHVAEAAVIEQADGSPLPDENNAVFRRPLPSRLSGESRLAFFIPAEVPFIHFSLGGTDGKGANGLLDWSRWRQSVTITAQSSFGQRITINPQFVDPLQNIDIPIRRLVDPGRLAPPPEASGGSTAGQTHFLLAAVDSIGKKLSLSRQPARTGAGTVFQPRINPTVQPSVPGLARIEDQIGRLTVPDPTLVARVIPKRPVAPNSLQTAIEMPTRLIVSPHETAGWAHTPVPKPSANGRFVMFHTRLGLLDSRNAGQPSNILIAAVDGKAAYRYRPDGTVEGPLPNPNGERPTIRAVDAVDLTANLGELVPSGGQQQPTVYARDRRDLVRAMSWRDNWNADSKPFEVENLMLTPLGGYLKGEWNWERPRNFSETPPETIAWRHEATLGRDQYVKIVRAGYLYPTGHPAALLIISERKFQRTAQGNTVAYLRQRRYVLVRNPVVAGGRDLGFQSITLKTLVTPVIDFYNNNDPRVGEWAAVTRQDEVFWIASANKPILWKMRAIDMDGEAHEFSMPMLFISQGVAQQGLGASGLLQQVKTLYERNNDGDRTTPYNERRRARLDGSKVSLVPSPKTVPGAVLGVTGTVATDRANAYPVTTLLFTAVPRPSDVRNDIPGFRPALFRARVRVPQMEMLGADGAGGSASAWVPDENMSAEEIQASLEALLLESGPGDKGSDAFFPTEYLQSGFGSGNPSQTFLQFAEKYGPEFKDVSKCGGLLNPNMLVGGLAQGKGPIGGEIEDLLKKGEIDPKKLLDDSAKILGGIGIADLIPNPIKVDPFGSEAPYLEIHTKWDDGKNKPPTELKLAIKWTPKMKNWGLFDSNRPGEKAPIFVCKDFNTWYPAANRPKFAPAEKPLKFEGSVTIKLKKSEGQSEEKPKLKFDASLENFRIDLIASKDSNSSFLYFDFRKIAFKAEVGKSPEIVVDLDQMVFTGPLTFIQKFQDLVNGKGFSAATADYYASLPQGSPVDFYLNIDTKGIVAGIRISIPDFGVGMFAIRNISIGASITLPWIVDPLKIRFNFCERNNPFQLSVMGISGGGFVALTVTLDGVDVFEVALEFGGSLSINLGVASGGVSIVAGIYYKMQGSECVLEAYFRMNGNLSVLGIIRINLEFLLTLRYESSGNRLTGTATLTVEIEILFFSVSVSVTVSKQFAGESSGGSYLFAGPAALPAAGQQHKFTDAVSKQEWDLYCEAFA